MGSPSMLMHQELLIPACVCYLNPSNMPAKPNLFEHSVDSLDKFLSKEDGKEAGFYKKYVRLQPISS